MLKYNFEIKKPSIFGNFSFFKVETIEEKKQKEIGFYVQKEHSKEFIEEVRKGLLQERE